MTIYQTAGKLTWIQQNMVSCLWYTISFHTHCKPDQLMEGLERVRVAMGSPEQSGFSDKEIKDALYYYQYDADKTVDYLIGMLCHFSLECTLISS